MYENSLKAIKKANRYRERILYNENLLDLCSNDYLGLGENKTVLNRAYKELQKYKYHSPKASILVNGYHQIHKKFENLLCKINSFEASLVVGSGFLANMALLETLPRKGDILILDEEYHASGILASKLVNCEVKFFKHNSVNHLEEILKNSSYKNAIVAVEGVYSMGGDLVNQEIFDICDRYKALLIVDEAHSSGVVGEKLLGVFELFDITPKQNHIKMGTLGKAYGSYGAYILASKEIIDFLQNRAKSIIYTTAPSLFDIALANEGLIYILKNYKSINRKKQFIQDVVKTKLDITLEGLILKIEVESSIKALEIKNNLLQKGFLIGAIRPPTVKKPILRVIPRVNTDNSVFIKFIYELSKELI